MKEYTYLEVQFIFEPSSTWQHVTQFESDLTDFFSAYGMIAQTVKTIGGQPGKKLFLVRRIETNTPKLDNKKDAVQATNNSRPDPRQDFKSENYKSFKSFSSKPIVPKPGAQPTIRFTKSDFNKGRSVVRKVYLKK